MFTLKTLEQIIESRASGEAEKSYTKTLLEKGATHTAKKFGEEAVEFVIAASCQSQDEVKAEAADVLYHLLVALRARNVTLNEILDVLEKRTQQSGLEEKAKRQS